MMSEADYDAFWAAIEKSHLADVYLWEVYWLADSIMRGCDDVFAKAQPPPPDYIKVEPELMQLLQAVVSASARLRALIFERSRRDKRNQSALEYAVQIRRARWLGSLILAGLNLPTIATSGVRNSLEHFDNHLDSEAIRWLRGGLPPRKGLPVDMAISTRASIKDLLKAEVLIRVYVAAERRFVTSDTEIDLAALHAEASSVRERLRPLIEAKVPKGEHGGFVVFPGDPPKVPLPD
jgi:hypothetical protein